MLSWVALYNWTSGTCMLSTLIVLTSVYQNWVIVQFIVALLIPKTKIKNMAAKTTISFHWARPLDTLYFSSLIWMRAPCWLPVTLQLNIEHPEISSLMGMASLPARRVTSYNFIQETGQWKTLPYLKINTNKQTYYQVDTLFMTTVVRTILLNFIVYL